MNFLLYVSFPRGLNLMEPNKSLRGTFPRWFCVCLGEWSKRKKHNLWTCLPSPSMGAPPPLPSHLCEVLPPSPRAYMPRSSGGGRCAATRRSTVAAHARGSALSPASCHLLGRERKERDTLRMVYNEGTITG